MSLGGGKKKEHTHFEGDKTVRVPDETVWKLWQWNTTLSWPQTFYIMSLKKYIWNEFPQSERQHLSY